MKRPTEEFRICCLRLIPWGAFDRAPPGPPRENDLSAQQPRLFLLFTSLKGKPVSAQSCIEAAVPWGDPQHASVALVVRSVCVCLCTEYPTPLVDSSTAGGTALYSTHPPVSYLLCSWYSQRVAETTRAQQSCTLWRGYPKEVVTSVKAARRAQPHARHIARCSAGQALFVCK